MKRVTAWSLSLIITAILLLTQLNLLPNGVSFSTRMRALNDLKNRVQPPQESDFDNRVTLADLLRAGDDRARWSEGMAARIEGFVVSVRDGGMESTNGYSFFQRDTHIEVALSEDAPPRERVELEVTPRARRWAKRQGRDWSTKTLSSELVGHWCRFEGWMLFDINHDDESENTNPQAAKNWRATAWEIHPVTSIQVIN